jgi:hypothetical protein
MDSKKFCFVISPIGHEGDDIRQRSNKVLKHIITPCVKDDFEVERADTIDAPGSISNTVLNNVVKADLVIADITDHNPNVFYELAIRHAVRKPVIIISERGTKFPFDIQDLNVIDFDHRDLDSVAYAKERLTKAVKHFIENPDDINTPIHAAIQFDKVSKEGNSTEKMLAEISQQVKKLDYRLEHLETSNLINSSNQNNSSEYYQYSQIPKLDDSSLKRLSDEIRNNPELSKKLNEFSKSYKIPKKLFDIENSSS